MFPRCPGRHQPRAAGNRPGRTGAHHFSRPDSHSSRVGVIRPPPTSPEPPASRIALALRRGQLLARLRQTVAPPAPARGEQPAETGSGGGAKAKVTALVRGAAALAKKVGKAVAGRSVAGGRVVAGRARTIREKRDRGRCVIVTEIGGRPVAIGPYRDEQAARQDAARVPGAAQVAQLTSGAAYFAAYSGPTTASP
jgi:hypothetical protein